jgi:signal transduction histidine kinase
MRTLAIKLTLAFLAVGISGALLVAVISGLRTRQEFGRFVTQRRGNPLVADLMLGHYMKNNSWEGIQDWLDSEPLLEVVRRRIVLVDAGDTVVYAHAPENRGLNTTELDLEGGIPIEKDGLRIGTIYDLSRFASGGRPPRMSPESFFLRNVNQATGLAALIAALLALALGILLSRALTRPLRELTSATEVMSAGQLGAQVNVYSQDEIGKLASSFNQMSSELAAASRLRKQMTADIAHDLRTPLTVLRGYTEGLSEGSIQGRPELYQLLH